MKKIFCILLVGLLLFATGCQEIVTEIEVSDDTPETTDITTVMEDTATKTTTAKPVMKRTTAKPVMKTTSAKPTTTTTRKNTVITNPSQLFFPFAGDTIVCHYIDSHAFYDYLENPSEKELLAGSFSCNIGIQAGTHIAHERVLPGLIDFAGSKEALTTFLSEQGIQVNVQAAVLLKIADESLPLTILVKTDQQPVFITVNIGKKEGNVYIPYEYGYRAYTLAAYREKFGRHDGKIIIYGKDVTEKAAVKFYCERAEIPLLSALETVTTIEKIDEKTFKIKKGKWGPEEIKLELESNRNNANKGILFAYRSYDARSPACSYPYYKENGDYIVSDSAFTELCIMLCLGQITIDMDAKIIAVT